MSDFMLRNQLEHMTAERNLLIMECQELRSEKAALRGENNKLRLLQTVAEEAFDEGSATLDMASDAIERLRTEKSVLVQALSAIHTAVNFESSQLENFIAGQAYTALAAVDAEPGEDSRPVETAVAECQWIGYPHYDVWQGDCGLSWQFYDGSPSGNYMTYCPKCGRKVVEVTAVADEEDDEEGEE